jgi:hypothetical protein
MKYPDDKLEKVLKKSFSDFRVPELKRDIASAVLEKAKSRERMKIGSRWASLVQLCFYWVAVLIFSVLVFQLAQPKTSLLILTYILVPLFYLGWSVGPGLGKLVSRGLRP